MTYESYLRFRSLKPAEKNFLQVRYLTVRSGFWLSPCWLKIRMLKD